MNIYIEKIIPSEFDQKRFDQVLALICPEYSRSQIQQWIKMGWVQVNGKIELKTSIKVSGGQQVLIQAELPTQESWEPEDIPLDIVYQDDDLLVINKPAGLVVHPGAGNYEHTLVNALLNHDPQLALVPRAGLVHRLDKETTGLLVVARHLSAHHYLVQLMQQRLIVREYEAIVEGILLSGGTVHTPMGRHPQQRTKMSVVKSGKEAITHYRVIQRYRAHTHIRVRLETGRTHQIRVHMAHIHHSLVGDPEYGVKNPKRTHLAENLKSALQQFHRQALHAIKLTVIHPRTHESMTWDIPLPADMEYLLQCLQEDLSYE